MVNIATVLSLVVGTLLPILVGRLTSVTTHPAAKGVGLLALSGITAVLGQWLDAANSGTPFRWQTVVVTALLTFTTGVAAHAGIWKHTPLSSTGTPFGKAPAENHVQTGAQTTSSSGRHASVPAPVEADPEPDNDISDLD